MHNNASRIVSVLSRLFFCMDVYSEEQTCHVEFHCMGYYMTMIDYAVGLDGR